MNNLYKGRGEERETEQLIAELNDIFFSADPIETRAEFLALLPKLYKKKYDPAYNNFIVRDGDKIKAAVGLYPLKVIAAGTEFKVGGIGNVGVSKDSRGKGYMKELMKLALDEMMNNDYDYSLLSGRRQRYAYFGYDAAGASYHYRVNRMNIEYLFGKDAKSTLVAKEVAEDDFETINACIEINKRLPSYTIRKAEDYVDIMKSWNCRFYAAYRDGEFAGYFSAGTNYCNEIGVKDPADTADLIMCVMETIGVSSVGINAPVYDLETRRQLNGICEGFEIITVEKINIFKYKKFIEAFLSIKAERMPLVEGSLVLLIHGIRADEQLEITVDGKKVTVCETDKAPDIELDHISAQQLICSKLYMENELPLTANSWFPVDFHCCHQDNV